MQRPQLNMLLIELFLDDSDKNNTSTSKDNSKESARSLQQPREADSPKEKKHLEFYEES